MIKLGNIEYSNCFPVHAQLLDGAAPANIEIVTGAPTDLNRALEAGSIDVAPSSSIEYARHASYRLLPDFVIASDGAVGSILLESTKPIQQLGDATIAVPTASATSVLLLKILMRRQHALVPHYRWFEQSDMADPVAAGADATLWIGDVALRRRFPNERHIYDLGSEWKQWTGLPFVFAVWQTSAPSSRDQELADLVHVLHESRAYFLQNAASLAATFSAHFRIPAARLHSYWQSLRYEFDETMQEGLFAYYRLASELGEAPAVERLRWL